MAGHGRAGAGTGRKELVRCFMVKGGRMKALRVVGLWVALVLGVASSAMAEGFALTEWSARGLGLASGMVGRADDVSAIAYNAAGITQLPGVQVMGGMALVAPMGTLSLDTDNGKQETTTKPAVWAAPHAYASWQLNDSLWLGLGVFSRFGLGNSYDQNWTGRYNRSMPMVMPSMTANLLAKLLSLQIVMPTVPCSCPTPWLWVWPTSLWTT